ncbi:MAG: hypothetical protein BAJALOKI3v1_110065 [Promethearchaeota archaeon]|nr:MAG: hypothetical protein BAJALOKI3v1_110065 [Candidatus Lokiarchaeota archaeon]
MNPFFYLKNFHRFKKVIFGFFDSNDIPILTLASFFLENKKSHISLLTQFFLGNLKN